MTEEEVRTLIAKAQKEAADPTIKVCETDVVSFRATVSVANLLEQPYLRL